MPTFNFLMRDLTEEDEKKPTKPALLSSESKWTEQERQLMVRIFLARHPITTSTLEYMARQIPGRSQRQLGDQFRRIIRKSFLGLFGGDPNSMGMEADSGAKNEDMTDLLFDDHHEGPEKSRKRAKRED